MVPLHVKVRELQTGITLLEWSPPFKQWFYTHTDRTLTDYANPALPAFAPCTCTTDAQPLWRNGHSRRHHAGHRTCTTDAQPLWRGGHNRRRVTPNVSPLPARAHAPPAAGPTSSIRIPATASAPRQRRTPPAAPARVCQAYSLSMQHNYSSNAASYRKCCKTA